MTSFTITVNTMVALCPQKTLLKSRIRSC